MHDNAPETNAPRDAPAPEGEAGAPLPPAPGLSEKPLTLCYLCGYSAWFELTPNDWRCRLCGRAPAVVHR
jgi:hypothetical protein